MSAYASSRLSLLRSSLLWLVVVHGTQLASVFAEAPATAANPMPGVSVAVPADKPVPQDISADALVSSAQLALSLIDAGEFSRLWRLSTADTKGRLPLPTFTTQMKEARASIGHVSTRQWAGIARVRYVMSPLKDAVPAGLYANVEFASRQLDGGAVFELVSLRIEDDGSLKFAGYIPRLKALEPTGSR